jgi:hypothetical protein
MAKGFLLGEEMPLQQDIQPLTIDDVSFTPIKASIPAREVELKELAPSTDFFIFPQASGSQTDGSGERIGTGGTKLFASFRGTGRYPETQILGYAQALSGAGTKTFVRISKA